MLIAAQKKKHDFNIGDTVLIFREIDYFIDYVGQTGLIEDYSYLGNAIVKLDDGRKISTPPTNLSLIRKSEVIKPIKTRKRKKAKEINIDTEDEDNDDSLGVQRDDVEDEY